MPFSSNRYPLNNHPYHANHAIEILKNGAEQALKHLSDPDPDTDTIARQLEQTARLVLTVAEPPSDGSNIDALVERYAAAGAVSTAVKPRPATTLPPLSTEQIAEVNRLRPTHTLKQLSEMFGRAPSVIQRYCEVEADFRGKHARRVTA